jgi:heptosyltransferase-1
LRDETYDAVIDTQGLLKSALISACALGPRHGLDAASAREPVASYLYDVRHAVSRELHAVERNRLLTAAALNFEPAQRCDYGLVPSGQNPLALRIPFCVLLSMTSRAGKLWPEGHWAVLVRAMASLGRECLLPWGSVEERARCDRIVAAAGSGVVPRRMTLGELAAVIKQANAVIGVDTGLAHLAVALGVPAVGLYCASEPALTGLHGDSLFVNLGGVGRMPSAEAVLETLGGMA